MQLQVKNAMKFFLWHMVGSVFVDGLALLSIFPNYSSSIALLSIYDLKLN